MTTLSKISYLDLRHESRAGRLPSLIGREEEKTRLERILLKQIGGNVLVVGCSGSGKTSFLLGAAQHLASSSHIKNNIVLLTGNALLLASQISLSSSSYYSDAFNSLHDTIVIIDDFGELISNNQNLQNITALLKPLLIKSSVKFILTLRPEELQKITDEARWFTDSFEVLKIETQRTSELVQIIKQFQQTLPQSSSIKIADSVYERIILFAQRFPALGNLPKSATHLLDECIAESKTKLTSMGAVQDPPIIKYLLPKRAEVTEEIVDQVISQKTGIPLSKLSSNEKEQLRNLEAQLSKHVVGQKPALSVLSSVIQRAKLGLRSQNRPLGSFLLLGPSGVGKTETAKTLSDLLYGREQSFLRIDMSEFGEAHTVHRLIGSPPGYVGFENGGQLTNHLKQEPYSLILLDEIEKANAKIFDIFLQLLDDGRLTSGQGETVDATQSIVMATSNLGVKEILENYNLGLDITNQQQVKEIVFPALLEHFRPEFLNRFDAILVYKPLSVEDLMNIAMLEIKKIEKRVKQHSITFAFDSNELRTQISLLADPRFGARPVKRFIEETCEGLITKQLLNS